MAASPPARRNVAVFGAAWAQPDSALYSLAVALGAALGAAGYNVVSGGYLGIMEGVSRGVRAEGGEAIGVLVPTLFPGSNALGNAYLSQRLQEHTLLTRLDRVIGLSQPRLIIALPGTLGTLTEICAAWNMAILAPIGKYTPFKLIIWRDPWERLLSGACEQLALSPEQAAALVYVSSVEEAMAALAAAQGQGGCCSDDA